jgi:uncharacterized membrane protein
MNEVLIDANSKRINCIDATRGLVMIIMALDHVRDFMHVNSLDQSPTNLQTATAALFLTRWVTHLCAPTFVFLSGVSAYISYKKAASSASRRFLFSRGLWLILLDFTVINFALWFDIRFSTLIMEVVCAIGAGLIVVSLLIKMPSRLIGLIGIALIFGHDFLDSISFKNGSTLNLIFSVLFRQNVFTPAPNFAFITGYPLVPWIGITLAGFSFGEVFSKPLEIRKKIYLQLGSAALIFFVFLRWSNIYGDPFKWSAQKNSLFTFLSFINVTKYPPSLLFTLLMLGIMLMVLWRTDGVKNKVTDMLCVYGKVPLFYFVVHLYLTHLLMLFMVFMQGFSFHDLPFGTFNTGRPKGSGVELGVIYLVWIGVVLLLFPICKWYGQYKANQPDKVMLRYL